jgi:Zn-dependent protease
VDVIGTVVMPLLMIFTGVPLLGWAKPCPVDPRRFKNLKRGQIVVSGAGPVSNLLLAFLFTAGLFVAVRVIPEPSASHPVILFILLGVQLNVLLAIFNMIPLPPLDGSHILQWALPNGLGHRYVRAIAPYGGFILLALVVSGAFGRVLVPIRDVVIGFLYSLAL